MRRLIVSPGSYCGLLPLLLAALLALPATGQQETSAAAGAPAAGAPAADEDAQKTEAPENDAPETETPETDADVTTAGVGQLNVTLQPTEITVGDRVEATLTLVWMGAEPSEPPRFPTWQETWGNSEILQHGDVSASTDDSGRRLYTQRLTLTSFEVGEVVLPNAEVVIPLGERSVEVVSGDGAAFEVVSLLPSQDETAQDDAADAQAAPLEPKPAAEPRTLADGIAFSATAAVLGLLNLAAAAFLLRRSKQYAASFGDAPAPWVPPLTALLQQLDDVDPQSGSEPVHTAISLAMRHYLSRHLSWNAAGSTTSEIQRQLRTTRVTPTMTRTLVQLFKECDQVKFARQEVSSSVNADRLARARELGRSLEVFLQPPPSTEAQDSEAAAPGAGGVGPEGAR